MMSSVPQFIDIEDKIAGPLTWKQLGWMIAMGAIILFLLAVLDKVLAIILIIPIVLIFVALAFYKPNGIPMSTFIGHGTLFFFRPKVAVWERPVATMTPTAQAPTPKATSDVPVSKELTQERLRELARMIDGRS
jgi:PrgI family protein